jgi:hypothetical protein
MRGRSHASLLVVVQIFAVLVTIYTQSDLIDGVFLLTEGPDKFSEICPASKFRHSVYLRVFSGTVGIVATFLLIVYSTQVVELLLNFTAMEFVAILDGSAFEVTSKGFLGSTLAKKTAFVSEVRYTPNDRGVVSRTLWYFAGAILVFAAFGTVWGLQTQRKVGDNEVYVQFDDSGNSQLFGVSGVYKGCLVPRRYTIGKVGSILYIPASQDCPDLSVFGDQLFPAYTFFYCFNRDGWIFSRQATPSVCSETISGDTNIVIRSSKEKDESNDSDSFDLTAHSDANWIVKRRSIFGTEVILEDVFVEAIDRCRNKFTGYTKLESRVSKILFLL